MSKKVVLDIENGNREANWGTAVTRVSMLMKHPPARGDAGITLALPIAVHRTPQTLNQVSEHANGDRGGSTLACWRHGRGSEAVGAGRGHRVRSCRGAGCRLGGRTGSGSGSSGGFGLGRAATRVCIGWALSSAKILDVLGAFLLKLSAAGVGGDALRVQFLADKGRNGLSVVLQAGHRAVGGARAFPRQVGLEESIVRTSRRYRGQDHQLTKVQEFSPVLLSQRVSQVLVWAWHHWAVSKVSEMRISLLVALAHTSLGGCHGAGVNGHVERAGVVRDLGRNRRSGNGEQSK